MRLLCGALRYRYYREGAARCRVVGTERADDHRGRGCGARQYRHAPAGRPLRRPRQEPGRGPGRRRPRARAGDVAGLRLHPDRPVQGPEPPRFGWPPARRGEISATGPRAGAGRRSAARQPPGRPRRRRPAPRSGAEPRDRLLSGRPARRPRGRTSAGLRRSGRLRGSFGAAAGPQAGQGAYGTDRAPGGRRGMERPPDSTTPPPGYQRGAPRAPGPAHGTGPGWRSPGPSGPPPQPRPDSPGGPSRAGPSPRGTPIRFTMRSRRASPSAQVPGYRPSTPSVLAPRRQDRPGRRPPAQGRPGRYRVVGAAARRPVPAMGCPPGGRHLRGRPGRERRASQEPRPPTDSLAPRAHRTPRGHRARRGPPTHREP